MADEPVPSAAPEGAPAAAGSDSQVSGGPGNAPGVTGDATVGGPPADQAPPGQTPAEYLFLNRKFRDQKHAEEILGSEVGKVRGMQRRASELEKALQQRDAELDYLRRMVPGPGNGQVQGAAKSPGDSGSPSFADELANSGALELFQQIAQDPQMGMGHAMYAMAQEFDKRYDGRLQDAINQLRSETIDPFIRQTQTQGVIAKGITAARDLAERFPELADYGEGTPDEVAEVQQEILSNLEQLPPVWLTQNPRDALLFAVTKYRETHGTPVFATQPGSSGSPSALASAAAERAQHALSAQPMDGSGVPRQRPNGQPETLADRIRRENANLPREATTPSGRKLGFAIPSE
jgi:hypothetical protein